MSWILRVALESQADISELPVVAWRSCRHPKRRGSCRQPQMQAPYAATTGSISVKRNKQTEPALLVILRKHGSCGGIAFSTTHDMPTILQLLQSTYHTTAAACKPWQHPNTTSSAAKPTNTRTSCSVMYSHFHVEHQEQEQPTILLRPQKSPWQQPLLLRSSARCVVPCRATKVRVRRALPFERPNS